MSAFPPSRSRERWLEGGGVTSGVNGGCSPTESERSVVLCDARSGAVRVSYNFDAVDDVPAASLPPTRPQRFRSASMISLCAGLPFLPNNPCCRPLQIVSPPLLTVTVMGYSSTRTAAASCRA